MLRQQMLKPPSGVSLEDDQATKIEKPKYSPALPEDKDLVEISSEQSEPMFLQMMAKQK